MINSTTEENLQELANLVWNIIEQKPEYKTLPPSNGGYL
jgi:hypothetical protein